MEQSRERLREQIDSVVLDGGDYISAHSQGCGVSVVESWYSGEVGFVGSLRGREGQVGVVQGRRVVYRVDSTIAIAVVSRRSGHGRGGVGQGGRRQVKGEGVILVLIPPLIALIFLAIVVFVIVEKGVDHGQSNQVRDAIIGMTLAALPPKICCYLLKSSL